jgi:cation:H+ antiporter
VTGSNRLLIGLGWSLVILIYWLKRRTILDMRGTMGLEMAMIVIATALTALIFIFGEVNLLLAVALILLFVYYLWRSSISESEEPELVGVARLVGALPPVQRRTVAGAFLVYAAGIILVAAEPFVEGLVETGVEFGIDEFILIQWLAPLASESPEIIVAVLFSLRSNPTAGLTTLISAEVNQLTLLIGSMVVLFSASAGELLSFPLDDRQSIEFMLTTAVSVFAVLLIAPRVLHWWMGALLLALFIAHLFFPDQDVRRLFAYLYFGLAAVLIVADRSRVVHLLYALKDQFRPAKQDG